MYSLTIRICSDCCPNKNTLFGIEANMKRIFGTSLMITRPTNATRTYIAHIHLPIGSSLSIASCCKAVTASCKYRVIFLFMIADSVILFYSTPNPTTHIPPYFINSGLNNQNSAIHTRCNIHCENSDVTGHWSIVFIYIYNHYMPFTFKSPTE